MSANGIAVESRIEEGVAILYLKGAWRLRDVPGVLEALRRRPIPRADRVVLDGSGLDSIDTAGGFVLLRHLAGQGIAATAIGERNFDAKQERLLRLVRQRMAPPPGAATVRRRALLERIGASTFDLARLVERHLSFVGQVALELLDVARRPALFRKRETVAQFDATCVQAIPIVALVNFLIGVVVADVLGVEAQHYSANLFVADGVALGVCRELSPIIGSVLVAGRSGAAFTAEIGTMKVEEEVDAIATLGLSPIQVLVIPRLIALVVAMPLLVLVGDIAGILGGMVVSSWVLDFGPHTFMDRVHAALETRHFLVGLGKAPVFAALVAMIACRMGLTVRGDARGVGQNITSTVVQCIVWVIILDAVFAVVFQRLHI